MTSNRLTPAEQELSAALDDYMAARLSPGVKSERQWNRLVIAWNERRRQEWEAHKGAA